MPFRFWQGGCGIDAEAYKQLAFDMMREAGVDLLLHAYVCGATARDGRVSDVRLCTKSGPETLQADCFVDATGDGDLCAAAGAAYELGGEDGHCMSTTLCFNLGGVDMEALYRYLEENPDELGNHPRLGKYIRDPRETSIVQGFYRLIEKAKTDGFLTIDLPESGIGMTVLPTPGCFHVNAVRLPGKNPVDADDLTALEILERRMVMELYHFMKAYIPGCGDSFILSTAPQVGVRESRRIVGDYILNIDDIRRGTRFEDAVVRAKWGHCDVHDGKTMRWSFEFIEGPFYVPYRSLIPKGFHNLFAAGRCISGSRMAMASLRIMPMCSAIGEASGTAAALCALDGIGSRSLDISRLQKALTDRGVRL
jgi:hypothetical protein